MPPGKPYQWVAKCPIQRIKLASDLTGSFFCIRPMVSPALCKILYSTPFIVSLIFFFFFFFFFLSLSPFPQPSLTGWSSLEFSSWPFSLLTRFDILSSDDLDCSESNRCLPNLYLQAQPLPWTSLQTSSPASLISSLMYQIWTQHFPPSGHLASLPHLGDWLLQLHGSELECWESSPPPFLCL